MTTACCCCEGRYPAIKLRVVCALVIINSWLLSFLHTKFFGGQGVIHPRDSKKTNRCSIDKNYEQYTDHCLPFIVLRKCLGFHRFTDCPEQRTMSVKLSAKWQLDAALLSRPVDLTALVTMSRASPENFIEDNTLHRLVTSLLNEKNSKKSDKVLQFISFILACSL